MARKIDFGKPLTEDELAYVNDRPWLRQDAEMRGLEIQTDDSFVIDESEEDDESEGDEDEESEEQEEGAAGDSDEEDADDEESDEEVPPYEEWEYNDLKEELGIRGLSKNGSKEQLIQRLTESDSEAE